MSRNGGGLKERKRNFTPCFLFSNPRKGKLHQGIKPFKTISRVYFRKQESGWRKGKRAKSKIAEVNKTLFSLNFKNFFLSFFFGSFLDYTKVFVSSIKVFKFLTVSSNLAPSNSFSSRFSFCFEAG